jgi:hypothetical protein
MGEIYEAEHLDQGRRVALKVLHRRLRRGADRARFLAEGQLAAAINHPNTVYIFEADEIGGIPVIGMELLPGKTLKDRVKNAGPLEATDAVDAILEVVEGLDAAHTVGILHRDVKPSNCFIDHNGTIKVGDFGLSITLDGRDDSESTKGSSFEGTPEFAAPERFRGAALDVRTDVYSVGATLYFLLSGCPPFEQANLDALIDKIATEPVRFSDVLKRRIPAELAALIKRCLAKQPADRPGSYGELRKELRRFASGSVAPATIGLRAAALSFDLVILLLIAAPVVGGLVGSQLISHPAGAIATVIALGVLYFGIVEGAIGAAYGKHRCGIEVVTNQGNRPGIARGLARATTLLMPIILWLIVANLRGSGAADSSSGALPSVVFGLAAAAMIVPVWRTSGFAGVHDIVAGTRVIKREGRETRQPRPVRRPSDQPRADPIGPYEVIAPAGATDTGEVVLGWDPVLKRSIWIHVQRPDAPPVPSLARNISRFGRLHWLQGQRNARAAWDAYESLDGGPLLQLPAGQTWRTVSVWLSDLARELAAAEMDRSVGVLALDRIWITADGRGKLLDFRAPGLPVGTSPNQSFEFARAQHFLHAAARHAFGSSLPPPPLSVSQCLHRLASDGFSSLSELASQLTQLRARPERISSTVRGMTLALSVVMYWFTADVLGAFIVRWLLPQLTIAEVSTSVRAAGLIGCGTLALFWAFVIRSGTWLRAFDIAVVTADGREASRLRAAARAAIAWSWVPVQILTMSLGGSLLAVGILKVAGLFYAADHPARGLQDRLTGTYLVPR